MNWFAVIPWLALAGVAVVAIVVVEGRGPRR
jgi:hypothetical protein